MAHLWKAGDLAVCVERSPHYPHGSDVPQLRATYRVSGVVDVQEGLGLLLDGMRLRGPYVGYLARRFRPILPAEPCFVEAMRSLKPRVEA
ncbi:hypothetical protein [Sphingobium sp. YC-XJ3]|uniref:hypothetical protein n=1 Tax=Sphingobium sp. YC-XJ3 TaxID=3024245 RepID=UPI00235EFFE4|nr:hypothetical protein [Sphingobium sp. YC-XJ3]WDA36423.1 hypothetical protein PO876_23840 [Sphingobium sp. YC-XJ3]